MNVTSDASDLSGLWTAKRKVERDGGKGGDESNDEGMKRQRNNLKWCNIHLAILYNHLLLHSESRGCAGA